MFVLKTKHVAKANRSNVALLELYIEGGVMARLDRTDSRPITLQVKRQYICMEIRA